MKSNPTPRVAQTRSVKTRQRRRSMHSELKCLGTPNNHRSLWRLRMHPISALPSAQGTHEPARFAGIVTMGMLLAASMGSTVSAQDAYGGITGPNYPTPIRRTALMSVIRHRQHTPTLRHVPQRGGGGRTRVGDRSRFMIVHLVTVSSVRSRQSLDKTGRRRSAAMHVECRVVAIDFVPQHLRIIFVQRGIRPAGLSATCASSVSRPLTSFRGVLDHPESGHSRQPCRPRTEQSQRPGVAITN